MTSLAEKLRALLSPAEEKPIIFFEEKQPGDSVIEIYTAADGQKYLKRHTVISATK